ncbi:MAG: hypothetical protein ACLQMH_02430 [Solirubrobacteraceae bacterium]
MSHRPLALVSGLTLGDYLLWNWSLSANHDVLALASGLTLPALSVAFIWLLGLNLARLAVRSSRRSRAAAGARLRRVVPRDRRGERAGAASGTHGPAVAVRDQDEVARDSSSASPGKLAA